MVAMDYGDIQVTRKRGNLYGSECDDYQWVGGPLAHVSFDLAPKGAKVGQRIMVGPFAVRIIDEPWERAAFVVSRESSLRSWFRYQAIKRTRTLRLVKSRLIMTAVVWGLAKGHEYAIPQWSDMYVVARMQKWLRRGRPS